MDVYLSSRFDKALDKLSEDDLVLVEDQIDFIVEHPNCGVLKKGDLSYLRVHKFKLSGDEILLGYSWLEERVELYLLDLGPHENFYRDMRRRRKSDITFMA
ncbi:type II toxin-antitoxin system RelE/ParE family toxin [Leptolyngbya cf. ectocarpi LEGE 11479]|uniref:Type II toxin-antitoxin system RelE/ParE family toxin n=1 Tax=Leptolyngbya cf. ectocarpi LEGE 11479 TaxID=1828722 RepID=A0A928ZS31_LEPEC|nr:type II toxin-antitoxin system RelE/ParE family toxin [Leptolyngbya ectocarpi]MBE9065517.1 type II toxin-antitoxin system RelE/ParE family toxin [Leptolyngbya cf. ectocarpi LEGE 11479]